MSEETLRTAARFMRLRASRADFWEMAEGDPIHLGWWAVPELDESMDLAHRAFISSMSPAVAIAVADWLDATVDRDDFCPASTPDDCHVSDCLWHRALAVATAYLGAPAPAQPRPTRPVVDDAGGGS